jgi:hypothetical protein
MHDRLFSMKIDPIDDWENEKVSKITTQIEKGVR